MAKGLSRALGISNSESKAAEKTEEEYFWEEIERAREAELRAERQIEDVIASIKSLPSNLIEQVNKIPSTVTNRGDEINNEYKQQMAQIKVLNIPSDEMKRAEARLTDLAEKEMRAYIEMHSLSRLISAGGKTPPRVRLKWVQSRNKLETEASYLSLDRKNFVRDFVQRYGGNVEPVLNAFLRRQK